MAHMQQLKFEQFAEHCNKHYKGASENEKLGTDAYSFVFWIWVKDILNVKSATGCWDTVSDSQNRSGLLLSEWEHFWLVSLVLLSVSVSDFLIFSTSMSYTVVCTNVFKENYQCNIVRLIKHKMSFEKFIRAVHPVLLIPSSAEVQLQSLQSAVWLGLREGNWTLHTRIIDSHRENYIIEVII